MRRTPLLLNHLVRALCLALALTATSLQAHAQVPGPEVFAKTPTTPKELWDAADYLVRTGQAKQAVPYLKQFMESNPDDLTLLGLRDRYGARSFLKLQDDPATKPFAEPLMLKLAEASRRHSTRPERLARFVDALSKSHEEQEYGVEKLREAGPYAVPAILQELQKPSIGPETQALILRNLGRLDRSAVPPLIATLDAPKPQLAAQAADALGRIGDLRALPALTALAATSDTQSPQGIAARQAIERLTRRPFASQPKSPVPYLTDEARRYHTHAIRFPGDSVSLWVWDEPTQSPVAQTVSRSDAESYFGLKLARAALAADPKDRAAQAVFLSLALEKAIERTGFDKFPAGDSSNTFDSAVAAGPAVLGDVLRTAIADGKDDLAAAAATALGKVTDIKALAVNGNVNPLVAALSARGRRTRFAAARALVMLDPRKPFAGSSRVVPVLAQFVATSATPRAVVIDGNHARGSQIAGFLQQLGYDPVLASTGDEGFKAASRSADTELVILDIHMILGNWRLHDTIANLRADARTAGLPIYVVGPLARQTDLAGLMFERFPGVKFLVTPSDAQNLDRQLGFGGSRPQPISTEERTGYAREAASLLAQVASHPHSPFEPDLARIEPELALALNSPETSLSASAALSDVPDPEAQRGLADTLIDPGKPIELRTSVAARLSKSIQRFGPLVTAEQERQLLSAYEQEADPTLRTALAAVIGALRPKSTTTGARLRSLDANPRPENPAPASAPASEPKKDKDTPETEPKS
jgi:HEAT repeat protein